MITTRRVSTGNAHLLPIDRNDPSLVLYLPLWYPHGDMTGTTISSYDKNRHTCTVTTATWGIKGRTLDGASGLITVPDVASVQNIFDDGGTIEAWINPASDGEANTGAIVAKNQWYFRTVSEASSKVKLDFFRVFAGAGVDGAWITTATVVDINTFSQVVITYDSSTLVAPVIYVNGVSVAVTTTDTPTGTRSDDSTFDVIIGNHNADVFTFDGTIGEVSVYNRTLSVGEIIRNYQATQWRYK